MSVPSYELSTAPDGVVVRIHDRGNAVLASPTINRGTAFTLQEREALGFTGLLPPRVDTLEGQARRAYAQYGEQANDLRRWVYLESLRDRNEVLFYRLLTDHISEMLPVIYTPTVGVAIQRFSREFRRAHGVYISIDRPQDVRRRCGTPCLARMTWTCWWPPTRKESWASGTRASVVSRSPSAS